MKRKLTVELLPSTKRAKLDPKTNVFNLLEAHGTRLTSDHLKSLLPELSIEAIHELLMELKDNPKSVAPGAPILTKILFSHLLTKNYLATDPSLEDFSILLSQFRECKKLPRLQGRLLNDWLSTVNCGQSNNKNLPFILQSMDCLATRMVCSDESDAIDLGLINYRLKYFVKTISADTVDLNSRIYCIISSLEVLTYNKSRNKLNTSYINEMLFLYLKQNPQSEELNKILKYVGKLHTRPKLIKAISEAWIEDALHYLNQHADAETSIERFIQIVDIFSKKLYPTKPLKMEKLQPIIDRMAEGDPKTSTLCERINIIRPLIEKKMVIGSIQGLEAIFDKINEKELQQHPDQIINILHTFLDLAPALGSPLPTQCLEKFLQPEMLLELGNKHLSLAFNAIYRLGKKSQLSGQFKDNFYTLVEFVANSTIENLDDLLILDTLNALGISMLHGQVKPLSGQSQSIEKLIKHLTEMKNVDSKNLMHAFNIFKTIAVSKKFYGVFHGEHMDILLKKLIGKNIKISNVSICLHNLGIIAREGYLEGEISRTILVNSIRVLLSCSQIQPFILFRCLTAFSDLMAENPLLIIDQELETIFDTLMERTPVSFTVGFRKQDFSDVEVVLRLPDQFLGKILLKLMPTWLTTLHSQQEPDIRVIRAINRTIDKLIKTKQLPALTIEYIQKLFAIFPKLNKLYPNTVLNILILAGTLKEKDLLNGELLLQPFRQYIQRIFNEQLNCKPQMTLEISVIAELLDNIRFLGSYEKLSGEINVLRVLLNLIVRSLDETKETDLDSIGDIFHNIQILIDEEKITLSPIKAQILEKILQVIIIEPGLQKEECLYILEGLTSLVEKELIDGQVDATIIDGLIAQLQKLDPEADLSEADVNTLLEYNKSNSKPTMRSPQLFFNPVTKAGLPPVEINSAQP